MESLQVASIQLNGVAFFVALFIFLLICTMSAILSLFYLIKSNQVTRLEIAFKRLHKENSLLKRERDKFAEKFYIANFQLRMMKNCELDELMGLPNAETTSLTQENEEEVEDNA